ncbi:hypothetical protein RXV86_07495 [Alisedimentitalea sp. MJ-SS2]|uniref:hypothetical protein n=1 Tax=Aliisedimentitalea sp. MJ-SS2 TaxID=3049795 RepID=UPI00290677D7|nr:hypothetical protein [Alisedimentitalea sp. MJ-SS2]MDU8927224.1 hypothetical protein [Alisedimentitalea sp. MJ-SS2]
MSRAKTISSDELNKVAVAAARSVLKDVERMGGGCTVGYFPDIGIVGLIWDEPNFDVLKAVDLLDISAKMASEMRSVAGDARVGAHIFKGGATAGYFPVEPIIAERLF